MTDPKQMSFSQAVQECVTKGWAQGDQNKMVGYFGINRAQADKLAMAVEEEFVRLAREHKAACEVKYKDHPMKNAHGKTFWKGRR